MAATRATLLLIPHAPCGTRHFYLHNPVEPSQFWVQLATSPHFIYEETEAEIQVLWNNSKSTSNSPHSLSPFMKAELGVMEVCERSKKAVANVNVGKRAHRRDSPSLSPAAAGSLSSTLSLTVNWEQSLPLPHHCPQTGGKELVGKKVLESGNQCLERAKNPGIQWVEFDYECLTRK